MEEYKLTFGVIVTLLNVSIIGIVATNIYKHYRSAMANPFNKKCIDFHFTMIIVSMVFILANCLALYTGLKSWVLNPEYVMDEVIVVRFADRFMMLLVAIGLGYVRRGLNPFKELV